MGLGCGKLFAIHRASALGFALRKKDLSIFALHNLYSYIKEGAVIIDTLAVKQNYLEQIINFFEQYPKKVRILSIHPLFKPILGFNNNNIIIIPTLLLQKAAQMDIVKETRDRIFSAADSLYEQAGRAAFPTVDAVRKQKEGAEASA